MMTPIAPWLAMLLLASLKGSILLLVALGAVRLMRRSSAESRHAVLSAALVAFLLLPVAGIIAPSWTVPLPPSRMFGGSAESPVSPQSSGKPTRAVAPTAAESPATKGRLGESPSPAIRTGENERLPLADRVDWRLTLVALWGGGTAIILLRLLIGLARLRVLSRRATMVTDGRWLQTAHALARRLGLTRGVTLLRGHREAVPMTWGVLSPVVWLPPAADRWPAKLRSAVLSHELAHVRRRDAVTQWLANAVVAVHWFNPLVWVATRALRAERERACDDAVLSLGIEADEYASHLLDMVRTLGHSGGPAPAMAMARRSQFEGRLLAILDRAASRAPVGSARLAGLSSMAVVLVLLLGGMRAVATPKAPDPVMPADTSSLQLLPPIVTLAAKVPTSKTTEPLRSPHPPVRPVLRTDAAPVVSPDKASIASEPTSIDSTPTSALLTALQGVTRRDTTLMLEIISAAEGISSNAERVTVLERIAKRPNLEPEVVAALGSAAGRVTSTTERVKLLSALIANQPHATGRSRRTVLDAIGTMSSSIDMANLLIAVIGRQELADAPLGDALTVTEKISTSSDKARVLVTAARTKKVEGEARSSYLKAARTITSDRDRARALSALFDGQAADTTGGPR